MDKLVSFIAGLPKAELHLHLEGSLEPEMMFALAKRNHVDIPFSSVDAIRAAYNFAGLQDFLDIYYQGARVLVHEQDFFDLTLAYMNRVHRDGLSHAEVFFDPQTHTGRGVDFGVVLRGIAQALKQAEAELGITSKLILCFLRHLSEDEAMETLRRAGPYLEHIHAVGLDSSEVGNPPVKFEKVFKAARERGLHLVAHAGEEGPPAYVRQALDRLHVERLDHGNRALEDADLTQRLVEEQMTLTVCPLSNLKLRVVESPDKHPLRRMLDLGLRVTVNSDDPAYFGGYINDNYAAMAEALSLDRAQIVTLAKNSFLGSFLTESSRQEYLSAIDRYTELFV